MSQKSELPSEAFQGHVDFQKKGAKLNRYIELCHPFSRLVIRSLGLQFVSLVHTIRSLG